MSTKTLALNLYHLTRTSSPFPDETESLVIAATTEKSARSIANAEARGEGYIWNDGSQAEARLIGYAEKDVPEGVVLSKKYED